MAGGVQSTEPVWSDRFAGWFRDRNACLEAPSPAVAPRAGTARRFFTTKTLSRKMALFYTALVALTLAIVLIGSRIAIEHVAERIITRDLGA